MDKVLVVEDDVEINKLLSDMLRQNRFETLSVYNGLDIFKALGQDTIRLILLDLMLPDFTGEQVLANIRTFSTVPIIVVSAKAGISDKVGLLRSGADDYITKPFHVEEVMARVESCIRRSEKRVSNLNPIIYKSLLLDASSKSAQIKGIALNLTATEYRLLETFILNPDTTFSKKQLFEIIWQERYMYNNDIINTHMCNLRKKLKSLDSQNDYIETVFGIGYRLVH